MTPDPTPEHPLTRSIVLDAQLAQAKNTSRVEVRRIRMLAGYASGPHVHNCPVVGSVVEGSVRFQIGDGPESILGPGDAFFEPESVLISHFDAGDEGATFLAYYLLDSGQEPEILVPER